MKICSRCKEEKLRTEFGPRKDAVDGLRGWCRACQRTHRNSLAPLYSGKKREYYLKHRAENLETERAKDREKYKTAPPSKVARARAYAKILARQEKLAGRERPLGCELCSEKNANGRLLSFDHCHKTGKFRGWICSPCNMALGFARDNPGLLRAMAAYLEE